ncbi:MAG: hypothetical protein AAF492_33410, partial [Verrucomicrobiota bacterium]
LRDPVLGIRNAAFLKGRHLRSDRVREIALDQIARSRNERLGGGAVYLAKMNEARLEGARILTRRFTEKPHRIGDVNSGTFALYHLVYLISGGSLHGDRYNSPLSEAEWAALQVQWKQFLDRHAEAIESGRDFRPDDGSGFETLIPSHWRFRPPSAPHKKEP